MLEFSELTKIKRVMNFFNSDFSVFVDSFLHPTFASVPLTDGHPKHSAEITPLFNMINHLKTCALPTLCHFQHFESFHLIFPQFKAEVDTGTLLFSRYAKIVDRTTHTCT
jgi:hypothetical protein